jgi:predicted nucleotidyltransferase
MKNGFRELIEKAATVLRDAGADEVYLFGSARGGEQREGSRTLQSSKDS